VKIKNLLIISGLIALIYFFFIAGKKTTVNSEIEGEPFIAGKNIYHDIGTISASQKAIELEKRFSGLNKKGIFNGTVLYAEHGNVVYKGAFGYENLRRKDTMNLDGSFQLASVSKMFTATAIMILEERRKLSYDDDITRFIPEFPYDGITIRQLLNHRSGLSRYMSLADKYWDINTPINNEDVVGLFVKNQPSPYFKPDDGFHYCNTNYALLASVVERITQKYFDEFVKEQIFDPLEMNHSFVYNLRGDTAIYSEVPVGVPGYRYRGWRPVKVGDYYLNGVMGDKGVYSTVEDLFRFNLSLDNETLVSRETLELAFSPGSPKYYRRKDNYGFGWRIRQEMDSTAYHFGWWKGFRTYFIRDMKNERTLIALTNTHKGISSGVLWDCIKEENYSENLLKMYHTLNFR